MGYADCPVFPLIEGLALFFSKLIDMDAIRKTLANHCKFILKSEMLREGDILLTTRQAFPSKAIRAATASKFSHALLCVDQGGYIHSDLDGVHSGNTQRLLFSKESHCVVLRPRSFITFDMIDGAIRYARNEIGKAYSLIGENRQFCSRLVAQAYEFVGVKLVKNSMRCSPKEILLSNLVEEVPNCLRLATVEDLNFAASNSPIEKQTKITNDIFKQCRSLTGKDIQTFEQLWQSLIDHAEYDDAITEIVDKSGYWTMWEYELRKNPWRYDAQIFLNLPISTEQLKELAETERLAALRALERYLGSKLQSIQVYGQYPREFFRREIDLYETLSNLHQMRLDASDFVLNKLG